MVQAEREKPGHAGVVLFNALTQRGFRAAIVAPSLRQSRKLIDKIDRLIPRLGIDVLEGLPRKGKLAFRNGSVIEALPNSPDTIRGETLNMVVADEFAYIEHDKELYDAIIHAEHYQRAVLRHEHSRVPGHALLRHGHGRRHLRRLLTPPCQLQRSVEAERAHRPRIS